MTTTTRVPTTAGLADRRYRDELLAAALDYADRGWHVFPLRPGDKRPAVPNHPAHLCDRSDPRCVTGHTGWEQRATTDHDRITRAWTQRLYGIGIACGPSRLLVVDLDVATDGGPHGTGTWSSLTGNRRPVPTRTVATPSGGHHLYYHPPAGSPLLGNTASRLGPRVDTRAVGGYVAAPPTHINAGHYKLTSGAPVAEAPGWLIEALTPTAPLPDHPTHSSAPAVAVAVGAGSDRVRRYVTAAVEAETGRLRAITTEGNRNVTLFHAAIALGQLVGADLLDHGEAETALRDATAHHLAIGGGYTPAQIEATIASGLGRGAREPRRLPADLADVVESRQR